MLRSVMLLVVCVAMGCGTKDDVKVGTGGSKKNNGGNNTGGSIFPDVRPPTKTDAGGTPDAAGPHDSGTNEPDAPLSDASSPPDTSVEDTGGEDTSAPDVAQNECPRMNIGVGGACDCDSECASGVCNGATASSSGACIVGCLTSDNCAPGQVCALLSGSRQCVNNDTGTGCTTNNLSNPAICSTRHCLLAGNNVVDFDHFCSVECDTSADCNSGQACSPVRCQFEPGYGYHCLSELHISRQSEADRTSLLASHSEATKLCIAVGAANECGTGDGMLSSDEQACLGAVCNPDSERCGAGCETIADCPTGGCVDYLSPADLPVKVCVL